VYMMQKLQHHLAAKIDLINPISSTLSTTTSTFNNPINFLLPIHQFFL
jgi:hypothetical protein